MNDRRYVFHFRPKPNIWPEKHLALRRIQKPKLNVQIHVKIGGILPYLDVSNVLSIFYNFCNLFKCNLQGVQGQSVFLFYLGSERKKNAS